MKIYYHIQIVFVCIFLISCGSSQLPTSNFTKLSDVGYLDGTYENNNKELLEINYQKYKNNRSLSDIFYISSDNFDSLNFKFSKKNVILRFKNDSGLQEKSYKGKLKENYFEVCLKKKIVPVPLIYFGWEIEKVRIGLNDDKNLLIQYWSDNLRWILIMASGSTQNYEYTFKKIEN